MMDTSGNAFHRICPNHAQAELLLIQIFKLEASGTFLRTQLQRNKSLSTTCLTHKTTPSEKVSDDWLGFRKGISIQRLRAERDGMCGSPRVLVSGRNQTGRRRQRKDKVSHCTECRKININRST